MIFLTEDDFTIGEGLRKATITNNEFLSTAESFAISEMKSYLAGRFDAAAVFATSGTGRNGDVVRHTAALTLYHAQRKIAVQNIPQWARDGRDDAIRWGQMILNNQLNPDLPTKAGTKQAQGTFRYGGNTKVSTRL